MGRKLFDCSRSLPGLASGIIRAIFHICDIIAVLVELVIIYERNLMPFRTR